MSSDDAKKLKLLEKENARLKRIIANQALDIEILKDVTFRLIPLTEIDAREMVREIKAAKILDGVRGEEPRDVDAPIEIIMKVSKMVEENPEITELDCNPVFLYDKGKRALVVDARILIQGPEKEEAKH